MHSPRARGHGVESAWTAAAGALLVLLSLSAYAAWEVSHRGIYGYASSLYPFDDADEWRYTACSRLVEHGYSLFDQVFSAQPPLLFLSLAASMRLFGQSIAGARWVEIGFGALALLATAWVAHELGGWVAAAASAMLLAASPAFLVYSHAIEAEGPMTALVTLAMALALVYTRTGSRRLLVLSGLVLAAAILFKLFAAAAIVPFLFLIVARHRERVRSLLAPAAIFGVALLVPLLLELLLLSPRAQWEQVVTLHQRAAATALPGMIPAGTVVQKFLTIDAGLTLVAVAGLAAVSRQGGTRALLLWLWVPLFIVMLLLFRPLFPHHAAILSTGLAATGGAGIGVTVADLRERRRLWAAPVLAAIAVYVILFPRLVRSERHVLIRDDRPTVVALASYVARSTSPSQFITADNLEVAERAGRLVPPPLCDPSNVRVKTGSLTSGQVVAATRHYRAALVVPTGVFLGMPPYMAWLRSHYVREKPQTVSVDIYRKR